MKAATAASMALSMFALAFWLPAQEAMGEKPSQGLLSIRQFQLQNSSANRLAPIVESALRNACPEAAAECLPEEKGNTLLISAPQKAMPLAEALVRALDSARVKRSSQAHAPDASYSSYKPKFIASKSAAKLIASLSDRLNSAPEVLIDQASGIVYWKGREAIDSAADKLMLEVDMPQTQMRVCFKACRLNTKEVQKLGEAYAKDAAAGKAATEEQTLKRLLGACQSSSSSGEAECSISQGQRTSSAILDAGKAGRFKITVSYPVVDAKADGKMSVYADYLFEYEGDTRSTRWTLAGGQTIPFAAFAMKRGAKEKAFFLDIQNLQETLNNKDNLPPFDEMLVICGSVLEASR